MFPMLANRKQEEENKHLTGRQLNSNERTTTEHQTDKQTNKQAISRSNKQGDIEPEGIWLLEMWTEIIIIPNIVRPKFAA